MDQDDKDHPKYELDDKLEKIEEHLKKEGVISIDEAKDGRDMSIDQEIKYTQELVEKEREDLEQRKEKVDDFEHEHHDHHEGSHEEHHKEEHHDDDWGTTKSDDSIDREYHHEEHHHEDHHEDYHREENHHDDDSQPKERIDEENYESEEREINGLKVDLQTEE